jgi:two-component system, chemotaxis family, sensor kinase Cph1
MLHRVPGQGVLVLELEAPGGGGPAGALVAEQPTLMALLAAAVQRFGQAANIGVLCDGMARCVRDLIGYDRVMVYKFDPDGHGKIIAEARHPRLDTLLGHQYPSTGQPGAGAGGCALPAGAAGAGATAARPRGRSPGGR